MGNRFAKAPQSFQFTNFHKIQDMNNSTWELSQDDITLGLLVIASVLQRGSTLMAHISSSIRSTEFKLVSFCSQTNVDYGDLKIIVYFTEASNHKR